MQSEKPASEISEPNTTCFPNKQPTYVVGFDLKETYEDLVTAQPVMCNKRSPQDSINTITPKNSMKIFEREQDGKLKLPFDSFKTKTNDENIERNDMSSELTSSRLEIENTIQKEDPNDNETINYKFTEKCKKGNQPEVLFNATNYTHRYKHCNLLKKKSKNMKTKYNKFKCKTPKTSIKNHLKKYYKKVKQNPVNCEQIQQRFSNISTVISRSRVLKKVLAKENMLEEAELISIPIFSNLNIYKESSLSQSIKIQKAQNASFISNASGNTLKNKSSTISPKSDLELNSVKSSPLINRSLDSITPYKTDVISVAVAVAYDYESKVLPSEETVPRNPKLIYSDSLVSSQTLTVDMTALTSEVLSEFSKSKTDVINNLNKINNDTLINKEIRFDISSDDNTYDMSRTSSEFNYNNSDKTITSKTNLEKKMGLENTDSMDIENLKIQKPNELQTFTDLGYSEINVCSSSATVLNVNQTYFPDKNANHNCQMIAKNMGDHSTDNKVRANTLKQQFNDFEILPDLTDNVHNIQTHVNLHQKKLENESNQNPSDLSDIWDRLVLTLDIAFKRLEESVTENIIREVKKSIASLKLDLQPIPHPNVDLERGETETKKEDLPAFSKILVQEKEVDECLQCNLVQSKTIDQIMLKLSCQGPKIMEPERSVKSLQKLKSKLFRDYIEVLKPPAVVGPEHLVDQTDTVTLSTVTEEFDRFHRMRMLLCGPLHFVRENVFVITSVPAFFVVLLFIYGLLMVIIKPW